MTFPVIIPLHKITCYRDLKFRILSERYTNSVSKPVLQQGTDPNS